MSERVSYIVIIVLYKYKKAVLSQGKPRNDAVNFDTHRMLQ